MSKSDPSRGTSALTENIVGLMNKAIVFQNFPNQHKDCLQIDHFSSHISATASFYSVNCLFASSATLEHKLHFFCGVMAITFKQKTAFAQYQFVC